MEFWHPSRACWHPSSSHPGAVESLVGFQNSRFEQTGLKISTHVTGESPVTWGVTLSPTWFEWRKALIRRDWNPLIKNACFSDQMSCFRKEPSDQNIVFLCCCSSEFLSEIFFICYRIRICWKIFLSDKLALTDERERRQNMELTCLRLV